MMWKRILLTTTICFASSVVSRADESEAASSSPSAAEAPNAGEVLEQLEKLKDPLQQRVSGCCDQLTAARSALQEAIAQRDAAHVQLKSSFRRMEIGALLLKSMCSSVCIGNESYSREDIADAVTTLILEFRETKQVHDVCQKTVAERKEILLSVETRVAKWQKAEREILGEISLLKAELDLLGAQEIRIPAQSLRDWSSPNACSVRFLVCCSSPRVIVPQRPRSLPRNRFRNPKSQNTTQLMQKQNITQLMPKQNMTQLTQKQNITQLM